MALASFVARNWEAIRVAEDDMMYEAQLTGQRESPSWRHEAELKRVRTLIIRIPLGGPMYSQKNQFTMSDS